MKLSKLIKELILELMREINLLNIEINKLNEENKNMKNENLNLKREINFQKNTVTEL